MQNKFKRVLKTHGILLMILGSTMTLQTIIGYQKGNGVLSFLESESLRAVGLFEAYLLAAYLGLILYVLSGKLYKRTWHLLAAGIHMILFVTNITFWEAYSLANIISIGYISTIAHFIFIIIESLCYILNKPSAFELDKE